MELTVTQNGAIYAGQRAPSQLSRRKRQKLVRADVTNALPTLRTSVGEFALLGLYRKTEAAREALINRRTGFRTWDALDAGNAQTQVGARAQ